MKAIWGKHRYRVGTEDEGFYYEVKNDKITKYCCDKMKKILYQELGGRTLTLYEDKKELAIESYDFDIIRPVNFCMCCGEKLEIEIIN